MKISPIAAFSDNYIWCIESGTQAWVVDPGCAESVATYLEENDLDLAGILITHHHADHTGGIGQLMQNLEIPIIGPANCQNKGVNQVINDGQTIEVFGVEFECLAIPGHTLDHIAFYSASQAILFCGDTLFAGGCGRIFEGNPAMMWQSLNRLCVLPEDTKVFCAHEYTTANLVFAAAVDGNNPDLIRRISDVANLRQQNIPTVPTTIGLELRTNPFLRAPQPELKNAAEMASQRQLSEAVDVFTELRAYKDRF
jgi:hydroxyacylglutathione hydrolase